MRGSPFGTGGVTAIFSVVVILAVAVGSWCWVCSAVMSEVGKVAASHPAVYAVYDTIAGQHADFTRIIGF